jgi:hypothetical protein
VEGVVDGEKGLTVNGLDDEEIDWFGKGRS